MNDCRVFARKVQTCKAIVGNPANEKDTCRIIGTQFDRRMAFPTDQRARILTPLRQNVRVGEHRCSPIGTSEKASFKTGWQIRQNASSEVEAQLAAQLGSLDWNFVS